MLLVPIEVTLVKSMATDVASLMVFNSAAVTVVLSSPLIVMVNAFVSSTPELGCLSSVNLLTLCVDAIVAVTVPVVSAAIAFA